MNYVNARFRTLRSHAAQWVDAFRETVSKWKLGRVSRRVLGEIPRATPRLGLKYQELDEQELALRILQHVDECVSLQRYARELEICPDVLPAFREQAHTADELAFMLSLIPRMNECPQLARAHRALTRYWTNAWTGGGVSDSEYRCTLKGAALYLRQHVEPVGPTVDLAEMLARG